MTYVYILSDYGEHGAEHVTATLDRAKLMDMIDANWPSESGDPWNEDAKAGLSEHLKKSDEELAAKGGLNCHQGWGGMQIHVVRLV